MEKHTLEELKPDFKIPLNIVYEDEDVIVLNKQAGVSVHPSINEPFGTIVNALIAKYPEIKNVGDPPSSRQSGTTDGQVTQLRPGIVHRLDKDTSGLLAVAKNQKTFEFLKKEWQEGKVVKKYLTLVRGNMKKEKGEIISELARSLKDFRKRMVLKPEKNKPRRPKGVGAPTEASEEIKGPAGERVPYRAGKLAITEYKVIKKFKDFSLVEISLKTGRTHQIRVHMASIGHPIAGDKIYGKNRSPFGRFPAGRQFLHAYYLSFSLPNGKKLALEADLPDDLEKVLTKLEK